MNETVEELMNGTDPSEVLSEQRMATFQDLEDLRDWVFGGTGINAAINDVFSGSMVDDEITNGALVLDFRVMRSSFTANIQLVDEGGPGMNIKMDVRSNELDRSSTSTGPDDRRALAREFLRNTQGLLETILSNRVEEWTP
jgi:hypothetical protein